MSNHAQPRHTFDFDLMALKEKYSLPDGWEVSGWSRVNFDTPAEYVAFQGAVVTKTYSRGPKKGRKNWSKGNLSSEMTLPMTHAELVDFRIRWSAETGICFKCHGTGQEWAGWSSAEGTAYRCCRRCAGTGRATIPESAP